MLGIVDQSLPIEVFSQLGVIFLLFWVGLHTPVGEIREVGRSASLVGVIGVLIPLAAGIGAALFYGATLGTAALIGAGLAATSVGVTSALLVELKVLGTKAARTILGAAVIDDILALVILGIAISLAKDGKINAAQVLVSVVLAFGFVLFVSLGGIAYVRRWPRLLTAPKFADSPLLPAVIVCLGLAVLSAAAGLAAVIGAFLAGMILAESNDIETIEAEIAPIYAFFTPFFFASVGSLISLQQFSADTALLVVGISLIAIVTKAAGSYVGARGLGAASAAFVAVGMVPRAEVGIIVAQLGWQEKALSQEIFTALVAMSLITTLLAPPLLKRLALKLPDRSATLPS